ncbi:CapA family protein [Metabacillus sediminilitoris]|uniref:CapA family protein n=1 Tax=Metabacillus sediminilitoris TaxID=2567941 RepID=A0A4S4BKL9_9BACI|nr:CapA family protein [Metabacillus sediminilitoris]QGQ46517.1 CapA family protein [Metabacillus sediminilitoris]THF75284.1 CapA family protein [Metabacillus sediminilitoris]
MRQERNRKRRRLKKSVRRLLFFLFIMLIGTALYRIFDSEKIATEVAGHEGKKEAAQEKEEKPTETTIKISAAGDFTLGTDENFDYHDSFVNEASEKGLPYFVEGLDNIFKEDDFTTVNLETTLTNATEKAVKKFTFKGDPSYANILELGGIEAVNLANNHIYDYLEQGYEDTIAALQKQSIGYFGYDHQYVTTVKGIKIGALGYEGWEDTAEIRNKIVKDITSLRNQGAQMILVHFHWGAEKQYVPNDVQKSFARYTIEQGADLILGHHPHVVQGIEEYKGKFIVYSLGNFMFGGNRNPGDKDTFVFQQTFQLKNGELTSQKEMNIIPFSISSVTERNNYQPTLLTGSEADRVKKKIIDVSDQINGTEWLVYETNEKE